MKKFTFLILLFTSGVSSSYAEIKLPSIFGDNMVLQQQLRAAIWGKANKNAGVIVLTSWDGKKYNATSDNNGNWKFGKLKIALYGWFFS